MHPHHHHSGHWPSWAQNYIPIAYSDRAPRVEVVQPTFDIPDWALFTGLGLLAILAFGGRR